MVLLGEIPEPSDFIVLNADPGMENSHTYTYIQMLFEHCANAGIIAYTTPGPNLYKDLIGPQSTRLDNPPYFTLKPNGKRGQLMQKCTRHYKIAPMDRAVREELWIWHGIGLKSSRIAEKGIVEKWIGLCADELGRVKDSDRKYLRFRYPLIEMGMTKADVEAWYTDRGIAPPPRSVCNACFANGLSTLKEMHDNRPADWAQAVAVDRAVRDLTHIGVEQPVYVSDKLIALEDLPARQFLKPETDKEEWSCDSGYCFT